MFVNCFTVLCNLVTFYTFSYVSVTIANYITSTVAHWTIPQKKTIESDMLHNFQLCVM